VVGAVVVVVGSSWLLDVTTIGTVIT
jgi:hypothetical protein